MIDDIYVVDMFDKRDNGLRIAYVTRQDILGESAKRTDTYGKFRFQVFNGQFV